MNTNKIITATEARKLSKENVINNNDVRWVFERIHKAATEGKYNCLPAICKDNIEIVESVLKTNGFKYCFKEYQGEQFVEISWDTPVSDEADKDSYF
jgi:hypothetical protein